MFLLHPNHSPIDKVLHHGVKQSNGRDERTRQRVRHGDGEDAEIPGVVVAVFKRRVVTLMAQRVAF